MSGDPMASGLMILALLFAAPLVLLVIGFGLMIAVAYLRNWRDRPKGPELIELSWRSVERQARRVVVEGEDPVACAEDDRRAVAALLAADREVVASLRHAKPRQRVIRHGLPEGSEGSMTVVEVVPAGAAARREAAAFERQFRLPVRHSTHRK